MALLLAGCSTRPPPHVTDQFCGSRAGRPVVGFHEERASRPEALVARGLSPDAVRTAEIIGALGALEALLTAEQLGRPSLDLLFARQALTDRVLLAMLDVSATLGAIDCEGERGDQLRGELQRREARRSRNLGLAGVLVGATTAALTGGLSLWGAEASGNVAGIVGGSLEAAIGGALLNSGTSGTLVSRGNLLGEIHRLPGHSTLFPPTVWRYLTHREAPGQANVAEEILAQWRRAGLVEDADGEDALFLAEGRFSIGDMERRDAMLDLLEARVALMSRDLRLLLDELVSRPLPRPGGRGPARSAGTP